MITITKLSDSTPNFCRLVLTLGIGEGRTPCRVGAFDHPKPKEVGQERPGRQTTSRPFQPPKQTLMFCFGGFLYLCWEPESLAIDLMQTAQPPALLSIPQEVLTSPPPGHAG